MVCCRQEFTAVISIMYKSTSLHPSTNVRGPGSEVPRGSECISHSAYPPAKNPNVSISFTVPPSAMMLSSFSTIIPDAGTIAHKNASTASTALWLSILANTFTRRERPERFGTTTTRTKPETSRQTQRDGRTRPTEEDRAADAF